MIESFPNFLDQGKMTNAKFLTPRYHTLKKKMWSWWLKAIHLSANQMHVAKTKKDFPRNFSTGDLKRRCVIDTHHLFHRTYFLLFSNFPFWTATGKVLVSSPTPGCHFMVCWEDLVHCKARHSRWWRLWWRRNTFWEHERPLEALVSQELYNESSWRCLRCPHRAAEDLGCCPGDRATNPAAMLLFRSPGAAGLRLPFTVAGWKKNINKQTLSRYHHGLHTIDYTFHAE